MEMNLSKITEEELMEMDGERLDDILSIYRNIYNASSILVENVTQLGNLKITDEDIEIINELNKDGNVKTQELFSLVNEIEYFKDHSQEVLNSLI